LLWTCDRETIAMAADGTLT